jgi:predicted Rossmann-fold nucleotide-binding protein
MIANPDFLNEDEEEPAGGHGVYVTVYMWGMRELAHELGKQGSLQVVTGCM